MNYQTIRSENMQTESVIQLREVLPPSGDLFQQLQRFHTIILFDIYTFPADLTHLNDIMRFARRQGSRLWSSTLFRTF